MNKALEKGPFYFFLKTFQFSTITFSDPFEEDL